MSSKTYFQYEGQIKSQEISEAISITQGFGPIFGFGSIRSLDPVNNQVTLTPEAPNTVSNAISNFIKDNITAHKIKSSLSDRPTHGLVTKTGQIFLTDSTEIPVQVYNTQVNYKEVLVFARFNPIPYPVENTPTFEAYFNESIESFYEFYKNSNDPWYKVSPKITSDLSLRDPSKNTDYTFEKLLEKVTRSVSAYSNSESSMILVGIYGEVNGELYSIVPYGGVFPQPLNFNLGYHSYYLGIIQSLLQFIGTGLTQFDSVKEYIDDSLGKFKKELGENEPDSSDEPSYAVPIGGIIMWSGSSVPNHYILCDGGSKNGIQSPNLSNRFIKAGSLGDINKTGGKSTVELTVDNLPPHDHGLPYEQGKWGDNANNRDLYPQGSSKSTNVNSGVYKTGTTGKGQSFEIEPPYYTLAFIMRVE